MSMLDPILQGYRAIRRLGTLVTARNILDFAGAGVNVVDDPDTGATIVTIPGGGGPESRDLGVARVVRAEGPTVAASATYTMLNITGAGYITRFFMSINAADDAGRQNTRLKVYVDGEVSPSIDVMMCDLSCSRGRQGAANTTAATNFFKSEFVGYMSGAFAFNGVGHEIYINIPFSTSIKVDITNGSGANSIVLGGWLHYFEKTGIDWGPYRKLHGVSLGGLSVAAYAEQNLVNVTGYGGVMHGMYLHLNGGDNNYNYLEGNFKGYVDGEGTPRIHYDSTEDYVGFPWYFWSANATRQVLASYEGCTHKNDGDEVGFYRWHFRDPLTFTSGFRWTWSNGEIASGAVVTNNTVVNGVVWFYEK